MITLAHIQAPLPQDDKALITDDFVNGVIKDKDELTYYDDQYTPVERTEVLTTLVKACKEQIQKDKAPFQYTSDKNLPEVEIAASTMSGTNSPGTWKVNFVLRTNVLNDLLSRGATKRKRSI